MMRNAYWNMMTLEALRVHLQSAEEGLAALSEAVVEWESTGSESPENVSVGKLLVAGLEKRVDDLRQAILRRVDQN